MAQFSNRGRELRQMAKDLVLEYMRAVPDCGVDSKGVKQAVIFRECGFDWGDYPKNTSSNQQYWVAALLHELSKEGCVERVSESGPWRLK